MTKWVFARLDPAAVRRDPNETQLFKSEKLVKVNRLALTHWFVRFCRIRSTLGLAMVPFECGLLSTVPATPGNLSHRRPMRIRQLEKTFDLMSLNADQLLELLGDEFSFARPRTAKLFDDAIHY